MPKFGTDGMVPTSRRKRYNYKRQCKNCKLYVQERHRAQHTSECVGSGAWVEGFGGALKVHTKKIRRVAAQPRVPTHARNGKRACRFRKHVSRRQPKTAPKDTTDNDARRLVRAIQGGHKGAVGKPPKELVNKAKDGVVAELQGGVRTLRFKEVYVPKLSVSNKLYAKEMQVETQVGRSTVKPPSAGQSNKTAMSAVQKTLDEWHKGKQSWQVAATHVSITKGKHPCDTSCGTDMAATQQSQDETRDDDTSHDTTTYIPQSLVGTPPQQMPCSHIIPRTMTQRKRRDHLGSPAVRMACKKWKARAGKLVGRPVIIGATPGVVTKHKIVDDRLGGQSDRFTIDLDHGDFTCATLQQVLRCLTTGRAFTTLR